MAKKPVQKTICGNLYEFRYLSPKVALQVGTRLAKLLGESMSEVVGASLNGATAASGLGGLSITDEQLAAGVRGLCTRLDESLVIQTVDTMIETVMVQKPGDKGTRRIMFETDFEGAIKELMLVVTEAVKVNFADFFSGGAGSAAAETA